MPIDHSLGYITNTLICVFQTELLTAASLIPQKPFPPHLLHLCKCLHSFAQSRCLASIPSLFFNFLLPGLMISTSHIYFPSVHLLSLFSLLHSLRYCGVCLGYLKSPARPHPHVFSCLLCSLV